VLTCEVRAGIAQSAASFRIRQVRDYHRSLHACGTLQETLQESPAHQNKNVHVLRTGTRLEKANFNSNICRVHGRRLHFIILQDLLS
jgi:hypothetical protein